MINCCYYSSICFVGCDFVDSRKTNCLFIVKKNSRISRENISFIKTNNIVCIRKCWLRACVRYGQFIPVNQFVVRTPALIQDPYCSYAIMRSTDSFFFENTAAEAQEMLRFQQPDFNVTNDHQTADTKILAAITTIPIGNNSRTSYCVQEYVENKWIHKRCPYWHLPIPLIPNLHLNMVKDKYFVLDLSNKYIEGFIKQILTLLQAR